MLEGWASIPGGLGIGTNRLFTMVSWPWDKEFSRFGLSLDFFFFRRFGFLVVVVVVSVVVVVVAFVVVDGGCCGG
jgi:hypothetical protein